MTALDMTEFLQWLLGLCAVVIGLLIRQIHASMVEGMARNEQRSKDVAMTTAQVLCAIHREHTDLIMEKFAPILRNGDD